MSKRFSISGFSEMLATVNRGRESIHAISMFVLDHKSHCFEIAELWLRAMRKADVNRRLTLFYVANDIVQHCKRKDASEYLEAFANIMQTAMTFASDELIRDKVIRVLGIWEARGIYHPEFVNSLKDKLIVKKPESSQPTEHTSRVAAVKQPQSSQWTELKTTEAASEKKTEVKENGSTSSTDETVQSHYNVRDFSAAFRQLKQLTNAVRKFRLLGGIEKIDIDVDSIPAIGQTQGLEILKRLNSAVTNSKSYFDAFAKEIEQRKVVIKELEKMADFYTRQNADVETVDTAYKQFGRKLKRYRKHVHAKRLSLSSPKTSVAEAAISSPTSGVPSTMKEKVTSCSSKEISTLDQRLSLLTQNSSLHETGSGDMQLNCTSPHHEKQADKSPLHDVGGFKPSPSQPHSACEWHGMCSVSPQEKERVDSINMDIDNVQCTPISSKDGGTPNNAKLKTEEVTTVTVEFIDLVEATVQSENLPETKSPVKQNPDDKYHVQSVNLPEAKSATQSSDYCCGVQNSCQQDCTHHQFSFSSGSSECLPNVKSPKDDIEIVAPQSSEMEKVADTAKPEADSEVNGKSPVKGISHCNGNVVGDMLSPNEFVCAELQRNESAKENVQSVNDSTSSDLKVSKDVLHGKLQSNERAKENVQSANDSTSVDLTASKEVVNGDDEVIFISEQSKVPLKKSPDCVHGKKNCGNHHLLYHMMQTVVAFSQVLSHDCRLKTKPQIDSVKVAPVKEIMNLYSLLTRAPSGHPSILNNNNNNKKNELDVIVISDETEESVGENFGNSSHKVQRQSSAEIKEKRGRVTENLEVMDMDLGSSDEEKL